MHNHILIIKENFARNKKFMRSSTISNNVRRRPGYYNNLTQSQSILLRGETTLRRSIIFNRGCCHIFDYQSPGLSEQAINVFSIV
jgi:hypothetical protein